MSSSRTIASFTAALAGALALAVLPTPSARASDASAPVIELLACSLGCVEEGGELDCAVESVALGQTLYFRFDCPIDLATVNFSTFRVQDTLTGIIPPATFSLDPADPAVVRYEPIAGGFDADRTYRITIPGANQDLGPYIQSTTGRPLGDGLDCTFRLHRPAQAPVLDTVEEWFELTFVERSANGRVRVDVLRERVD